MRPFLEKARVFEDHFEDAERPLGAGSYAVVKECTERCSGERLACKVVRKAWIEGSEDREALETEIRVMQMLQGRACPGVVQLREVVESDAELGLVMELCRGGDLFHMINDRGPLPEPAARAVFRQLLASVSHCHSLRILHRDLKLENFLLDSMPAPLYDGTFAHGLGPQVKLADFGSAMILPPGKKARGRVGSLGYCAPEVWLGQEYDFKADVWSLGVVLFCLLSGNIGAFLFKQMQGDTPKVHFDSVWNGISPEAKDIVSRMLTPNPRWRVGIEDLQRHPWITGAPTRSALDWGAGLRSVLYTNFARCRSRHVPGYQTKA